MASPPALSHGIVNFEKQVHHCTSLKKAGFLHNTQQSCKYGTACLREGALFQPAYLGCNLALGIGNGHDHGQWQLVIHWESPFCHSVSLVSFSRMSWCPIGSQVILKNDSKENECQNEDSQWITNCHCQWSCPLSITNAICDADPFNNRNQQSQLAMAMTMGNGKW